jgi:flagellar basal-body rod protein FlgC
MTMPPITSAPMAPQRPNAPRPMFSALAIASSGLSAQRTRMDVIAQNLANAETTRTPQGGPYHRRFVQLEAIAPQDGTTSSSSVPGTAAGTAASAAAAPGTTPLSPAEAALAATQSSPAIAGTMDSADATGGVRVTGIVEDKSDGPLVYDPAHPDADKNGYVRMPNVRMTDEMMDLMNARRLYEANATVFQVARAMLHKAIDI